MMLTYIDHFNRKPINCNDIAKICKVSPKTVQEWCRTGKLHSFKTPDDKYKILVDDLCSFATRERRYYWKVAHYIYGLWIESMASKPDDISDMLYSIYIRQAQKYREDIDVSVLTENFKLMKEWYNSSEAFTRIITFTGVEENIGLLEFGEDKQ